MCSIVAGRIVMVVLIVNNDIVNCSAKVVIKSHMRKGYAIFLCRVYGVKAGGICQTTGKSKTGGGD